MYDLYDFRGFVLRTANVRVFWAVAKSVLFRRIGYLYVHRDGMALGQARTLDELNELM